FTARVPLSYQASACSLSSLHFLKILENSFEVLKLLENSMEVLKILENNFELMKILENKLKSLKLHKNQPVDTLLIVAETEGGERAETEPVDSSRRWKDSNTSRKKVHKKVLRYFSIIPRLQCLYNSSHTTKEMTWHATGKCTEPDKMQHLVDSRAWKNFDTKQAYNMWPMILTTYNLPLWLCMKESSFMLTLLIPGPKSPGKNIDVYLRPLIDDLKDLWAKPSVETIDVATGEKFNMKAMVLLTISDFLARSSLFGWSGQGVKLPDGFGSNFKHKVTDNDTNITSPKSHDCHIIMQRLLPYGLHQYFPDEVAKPIIKLCSFFMKVFFVTLMENDMLKVQSKVVNILCNLELIYPPAFVDIMIHLVIHLPLEALEGKPIRPRWMYPFERFMKKLKNYVRHKAKSEGLIAKGYVGEEALTFSSHYFRNVTTKLNRPDRNVDPRPPTYKDPGVSASRELFSLVCGPTPTLISVNSCVVNGVRFFVHSRDECRTTQNNGICSPGGKDGEMYYVEDDLVVIHFDNSSDLSLSTSLNDLDFTILHIDGQSTDVDASPDIIDVDEDDDIIDDEDAFPHDLADNEDLVKVDDDNDDISTNVARGHDGDGGGDDRPPSHQTPIGCGGCLGKGTQKPNLGGKKAGMLHTRQETQNIGLKKITDLHSPTFFQKHTVGGVFLRDEDRALYEEMLRLQGLGSNTETGVPYTEDEIMAIVRKGKQRGNLLSVGMVLPGHGTYVLSPPCLDAHTPSMSKSSKRVTSGLRNSGIGGCGDDESSDDEDGGEDEEDADS
nr:hypothetical protein [Tanacetum cinerariifolium]